MDHVTWVSRGNFRVFHFDLTVLQLSQRGNDQKIMLWRHLQSLTLEAVWPLNPKHLRKNPEQSWMISGVFFGSCVKKHSCIFSSLPMLPSLQDSPFCAASAQGECADVYGCARSKSHSWCEAWSLMFSIDYFPCQTTSLIPATISKSLNTWQVWNPAAWSASENRLKRRRDAAWRLFEKNAEGQNLQLKHNRNP